MIPIIVNTRRKTIHSNRYWPGCEMDRMLPKNKEAYGADIEHVRYLLQHGYRYCSQCDLDLPQEAKNGTS